MAHAGDFAGLLTIKLLIERAAHVNAPRALTIKFLIVRRYRDFGGFLTMRFLIGSRSWNEEGLRGEHAGGDR